MRNFLNVIKAFPHAEERPEGASRSTRDRNAVNSFTTSEEPAQWASRRTHDVDPIPSHALSPGREGDAAGASASCIPLALSLRTEVGRSSGLNDAAHAAAAIAIGTRIAFVAIYRPAMLEIAELAISLNVVAERGSAGLDGLGQNRSNSRDEPVGASPTDRRGEASRRHAGPEQRLANID